MEATEAGTEVMINGSGFTGATAVQFGSAGAVSFKVNSNTSISAVAPPGKGTVDVRVTTPVSQTALTPSDRFTYATRPTVSAISPKEGPEAGGTEVTITGTNFTAGSKVAFATIPASNVKFISENSITAVSPPGSGTINVEVTNAGGSSMANSADKFAYRPAPSVAEVNPNKGLETGKTLVTIKGKNFRAGAEVKFGPNSATNVTFKSETEIEAESPEGTGTVHVTVITTGGTSETSSLDEFSYLPRPTVSEVNPTKGGVAGGTKVTIKGTNFHEGAVVTFGGNNATGVKVNSETEIEAESPASTTGTGPVHVTVTTAAGTSVTFVEFTYE
jgi:hypothetical protein